MAGVRLRLLAVLVAVVGGACSGDSVDRVEDADPPTVEAAVESSALDEPAVQAPDSLAAFLRWMDETAILVNGVEVGAAMGILGCFADECSYPVDYHRGAELVIPPGAELRFAHPDIDLTGSARRLSEELRFRTVDTDGSSTFRLAEPGLHHLSIQGELRRENGPVDRFHHFAWVQVTEPAARCGDPLLPVGSITGVTDRNGCPSDEGELNYTSLHPSFHCHPWPAELRLDERPGLVFVESGSFRSAGSADRPRSTGLRIPSGAIVLPSEIDDQVYVVHRDGQDRWVLQEGERGCA